MSQEFLFLIMVVVVFYLLHLSNKKSDEFPEEEKESHPIPEPYQMNGRYTQEEDRRIQ